MAPALPCAAPGLLWSAEPPRLHHPARQVPDPQRLVPPVAPRREAAAAAEPSWACPHCRHVNPGGKAECARCRLDNPADPRASAHKVRAGTRLGGWGRLLFSTEQRHGPPVCRSHLSARCTASHAPPGAPSLEGWQAAPARSFHNALCCRCGVPASPVQDPLTASEEELARAACERHHPGLNRAFLEAGTPWSNVRAAGQTSRRRLDSPSLAGSGSWLGISSQPGACAHPAPCFPVQPAMPMSAPCRLAAACCRLATCRAASTAAQRRSAAHCDPRGTSA